MNLKKPGGLRSLTVLAGLCIGCSQSAAQSQAGATSPSQSGPIQSKLTTRASAATAQASASFAGEYEGEFNGASAAVTISGSPPRYRVHLIVGGDGCAGGALGPASVDGAGALSVRPTDDASCTITMRPTARGFSVEENHCSNLHGDSCAFSGELHRAH